VTWIVSSLRAAFPQFNIPFLISTIFSLVGLTFGPGILGESDSLAITKQLLLSYLTGFGISTLVGLLVFPVTSRSVFLEASSGYLELCHVLLEEERNMLRLMYSSVKTKASTSTLSQKASVVQALGMKAISSMSHLTEELSFAKNEIAIGRHSAAELQSILLQLQALLIPLLGLSKIGQLDQLAVRLDVTDSQSLKLQMLSLCCFDKTLSSLEKAVRQFPKILGVPELTFRTRAKKEDHGSGNNSRKRSSAHSVEPGHSSLSTSLKGREQNFRTYRLDTIRRFIASNDTNSNTPPDSTITSENFGNLSDIHFTSSKQLQQHLYVQHLLFAVTAAAQNLEKATGSNIMSTTSSKRRLLLPLFSSPINIVKRVLRSKGDTHNSMAETVDEPRYDYQGHPEHLLPTNFIQELGDNLRAVFRSLTSDSSKFGFRVTAATFSIGILAFLEQTQHFFVEFRLVWAMVM
jgi:hypothetical protein